MYSFWIVSNPFSEHEKFDSVRNVHVILYSANSQMEGKPAQEITIGEAVDGVSTDSFGVTLETLCR